MARQEKSIVSSRCRLESAIEHLRGVIAEVSSTAVSRDDAEAAEARDVLLCRAVRTAYTYYADFCAWSLPADQEDVKRLGSSLIELAAQSLKLLQESAYSSAKQYQNSVEEKLEMIQGLQAGKSLTELLEPLLAKSE